MVSWSSFAGPPQMPATTPVGVIDDAAIDVDRVPAASCDRAKVPLMFAALPGMLPMTFDADTEEIEASLSAQLIGMFPGMILARGIAVTLVPRTPRGAGGARAARALVCRRKPAVVGARADMVPTLEK